MPHASPSPEPQLLRCATTADFLAALPRLAGFTATDSLFLVLFHGSRAASTLRVDLPPDESTATVRSYLAELQRFLERDALLSGHSAPAVVISSAQTFAAAGGAPWRKLALLLERRLERMGARPRELCCLAPDGWVSFFEPSPPRFGHPLTMISASPVASMEPVPELRELRSVPEVSAAEQTAIAQAIAECVPEPLAAADALALLAQPEIETRDAAKLIRYLSSEAGWTAVFDALSHAAAAARTAHDALPQHSDDTAALATLRAAAERLSELVPRTPEPDRAMLLALSALTWWFRGLESVAQAHIDQALFVDPHHRIARLAERIVATGSYVKLSGIP